MATLTIKGNVKVLETIAKSNRLRAAKYGLDITLKDTKKPVDDIEVVDEVVEATSDSEPSQDLVATETNVKDLKAEEAIALIEKVTDAKELEKFKSDKRVTVKRAIEEKELELDEI